MHDGINKLHLYKNKKTAEEAIKFFKAIEEAEDCENEDDLIFLYEIMPACEEILEVGMWFIDKIEDCDELQEKNTVLLGSFNI